MKTDTQTGDKTRALKRVMFHSIGLRQMFDLRMEKVNDNHRRHVEVSLAYLAIYFDEIVIAPGAFFVAFNKTQFSQFSYLFSGPIAKALAQEQVLCSYADHLDGTGLSIRSEADRIKYSYFLIDRYRSQGLFETLSREEDGRDATFRQAKFFSQLKLLPRSVSASNLTVEKEIRLLLENGLAEQERRFFDRMITYVASEGKGFHHQKLLWGLYSGRASEWSSGAVTPLVDLIETTERIHRSAKVEDKEQVYRYSDQFGPKIREADPTSGLRFDPHVLRCIFELVCEDDTFTEHLLSLSQANFLALVDRAKDYGFSDMYHKLLSKHSSFDQLMWSSARPFESSIVDRRSLKQEILIASSNELTLQNFLLEALSLLSASSWHMLPVFKLIKIFKPLSSSRLNTFRMRVLFPEIIDLGKQVNIMKKKPTLGGSNGLF